MPDDEKKQQKENETRREFIKRTGVTVGVAAGAVALSGCEKSASIATEGIRWGFLIDLRKCYGCKACTIACKSEFNVPLGVWRSWVTEIESEEYPYTKRHFIPQLCNQCDKSPCVQVCPTGASFKRDDGIVTVDSNKCIGCKACIAGCPYGTRFLNPVTKVVEKCDFCIHRVEKGLVPSCVNTCPSHARVFGDLNDPNSEISKLIQSNPVQVLKPEMNTGPRVYYIGLENEIANTIKKPRRRQL